MTESSSDFEYDKAWEGTNSKICSQEVMFENRIALPNKSQNGCRPDAPFIVFEQSSQNVTHFWWSPTFIFQFLLCEFIVGTCLETFEVYLGTNKNL